MVKRFLAVFAVVLLAAAFFPSQAGAEEKMLKFNSDYPAAVKQAKQENKAMVVEFETAWCPFCRAMERVTFKDPGVLEVASQLVLAKVDADTQESLAKRFKVGDGFPLFVFLDRNQKELFRLDGYHPPESFKLALQSAADENSALSKAVRAAEANPKDSTALLSLGDSLYSVGAIAAASDAYQRAMKSGAKGDPVERAASRVAEHCRDMGDWTMAEDLYKKLLSEHGSSERAPFYRLGLVKTYVGWGKEDLAKQEASALAKEHPEHSATKSAEALVL